MSTPQPTLVYLSGEFIANCPAITSQNWKTDEFESGFHFGSQYPGDPTQTMVYDYLPDPLLTRVSNISDFAGVFVFDMWASNHDSRQAVFIKGRLGGTSSVTNNSLMQYTAMMIDHGHVFGGDEWTFRDSPVQRHYMKTSVYDQIKSLETFQPWLRLVCGMPESVLNDAVRHIPSTWLHGDRENLEKLIARLWHRRSRLSITIEDAVYARASPFKKLGVPR